ncbi:glycosyltransferase [Paenisporosarcina macmurdoensis]|uniref:Glycosyltransferase n=1 Tax=Paenisporosarcina macmurdoensis TaxID=212659 RepID=A0ABW1L7I7_9BACL
MVSINCITYNHKDYIMDALDSFLMQITDFNYEILIGEDCSTDTTRKIVEEYVIQYPDKIRLITSEQNVGWKKNSLKLHENSLGKYIAICEGDDYWTDPFKLQKQVDYMERHKECSLCFHAAEIVQAPNKPTGSLIKPYKSNKIAPIEDLIFGGGGFCPTPSLLFPRKLMDNLPDFYLNAHIGDYPMQLYLASKGYVYFMNENMAVYRSGVEGSWTNRLNNIANVRGNIIRVNEDVIQLLDGFNSYTNKKNSNVVEKVIQKLEYELLVLKRKTKEQKNDPYKNFSYLVKFKIRMKMMIRCYFPKIFLKLVNFKLIKLIKRKKN